MKKQIVYELSLNIHSTNQRRIEMAYGFFVGMGTKLSDIVETKKGAKTRLSVYLPHLAKANVLRRKLLVHSFPKRIISLKRFKDEDWKTRWKDDFKPFALTKHIQVVPAWLKDDYQDRRRRPLYLDSSLAFGTGLHETTRYTAQLIESLQGKFKSFLDLGTGTGILTIVALFCGAEEFRAIDISDDAVQTAKKNLARNNYPDKTVRTMDIATFKSRQPFDLVAANLLTKDLIAYGRRIIYLVKPNQYLAVSGISRENFTLLRRAFKKLPLRCLKVRKGKKWVAVLYKRSK